VPRLQQLRLRENQLFLALTIVIGVLAGLSAVLFSLAIDRAAHAFFGISPTKTRLFIVPPLVSLVTGALLAKVFPDVRGSGVPQTEAAFHLNAGVIPARVPLGKFLLGILCIGSGHSMGREGPSVQIGAGLASVIGQWLHLPPRRVRDLVPVGAAGALAAAFNTPVAAVLFALEEIIGDMNAALLGSTVVASVASVVVERSILGNEHVDQALNGGLVLRTLVLLCVVKMVATIVSYSSGNAGGIFAPTLYIGAMAGGAIGTLVHQVAPVPTADPGAYALVGMGTLFAGIIRAPMTSVFMIFEITQDYQILVPLMVANLLSFMISRRYQPTPVYHALLEQDHVHLPSPGMKTGPRGWTARDIMSDASRFIAAERSVESVWQERDANNEHPWLVGTA